jgi:hypothetical protein
MEAVCSSEPSISFCETARHHIPESTARGVCYKNLKSNASTVYCFATIEGIMFCWRPTGSRASVSTGTCASVQQGNCHVHQPISFASTIRLKGWHFSLQLLDLSPDWASSWCSSDPPRKFWDSASIRPLLQILFDLLSSCYPAFLHGGEEECI